MFTISQKIVNEGPSAYVGIVVYFYLEAPSWDWANTSAAGTDLRVYKADGTAVPLFVDTWDRTNQLAIVACLIDAVPVGETFFIFEGGDLVRASVSSYDAVFSPTPADDDLIWHIPCSEGAGSNLNFAAGGAYSGVAGTFNGTWLGAPGGRYGRGRVNATFATGNAIVLNGVDQMAKFPGVMNGGANAGLDLMPHEGMFSMWVKQLSVNPPNKNLFGVQRFGLYAMYAIWQGDTNTGIGNNTLLSRLDAGGTPEQYADLLSGGAILGPLGGTYTEAALDWHFLCWTWGGRGFEMIHDGQVQDCSRNLTNRPRPLTASGSATGLFIGNLSDNGVSGNAGQFANVAVSRVSLHGRQPSYAEISQMMHGMKMHNIRTAHSGRIRHLGMTISPDMGAAYNLGQWSEPVERADPNTPNRDYIISRAASLNSDSGVICSGTSAAGLQIAPPNLTRLVGAGFGGEAQAALCPAPRTISGTHYLIYSRHDFGTSLALAKSTNIDPAAASYAKQFNMTTPGYAGGFGNKDFWLDPDGVTVRILLEGTPSWTLYAGTVNLATGVITLDLTPLGNGFKTSQLGDASGPDVTIGLGDGRIHVLFHSGYQSAVFHVDGYSLKAMRWSLYDMVFDFIPGMLAAYSAGQHQTQAADASMREKTLPLTGVKLTRFVHAANTGGGGGISAVITSEADYGIADLFKPSVRSEYVPPPALATNIKQVIGTGKVVVKRTLRRAVVSP